MFYKLGKELFKLLINFLQFLRVVLVFMAFATTLYWIMQLAGATFFDFITMIFESLKAFIHSFYTRTVEINSIAIDFSFLLATFIMLGISWGLKYAVEALEQAEEKYDAINSVIKRESEKVFNLALEQQYLHEENKNNNVLILIKISALNLAKDSYFNKDVNVGVEEKQIEVVKELSEIIHSRIKCQKRSSKNELLISLKPFESVDDAIIELKTILKEIKNKYKQDKWQVSPLVAVETYAKEEEAGEKLSNLKKLVKLGMNDEIACLSTFKQRYSLLKNPKHTIEGKGLYTINDKEETVFCVEKISST